MRLSSAMEAIHWAPMLSRPMIGRKMTTCRAVKATIVPIDTGWVIMFVPAARYTAAGMMANTICMVMVRQRPASSARRSRSMRAAELVV